ncbi:PilZ domain-containing protein [Sphingomonas glaciei]|uniref:PilZ domain-containing protein n=1 Tax=Sphingomonas glaciei TaxID=2938948 RepID=A0ABY5MT81_9SPHN|nr:PilZ domain-containing protein [Sphingomonas glaciei]UUR07715.1 PilZ domain-containing protein [Sphingomonas glaciei]
MSIAVQAASPLDAANRRYTSRRALRLGAVLSDSGIEVVIHDLSPTGLLIETTQALCSGETLFVDLPERGPTAASVVWSSGNFHGCAFELSIPAAVISAALLKSPVAAPPENADAGLDIGRLQTLTTELVAVDPIDERYSLRTRGLVLGGLLALSWGSIGWAISALL